MMEKMKELESRLAADKALAEKYQEALKTAGEKGAKSDSEAISAAAAAIGIQITPEEVERSFAEGQNLSEDELKAFTGGCDNGAVPNDEYGHDGWCVAGWHCLTAFLHTESEEQGVACWSDYSCALLYHIDWA